MLKIFFQEIQMKFCVAVSVFYYFTANMLLFQLLLSVSLITHDLKGGCSVVHRVKNFWLSRFWIASTQAFWKKKKFFVQYIMWQASWIMQIGHYVKLALKPDALPVDSPNCQGCLQSILSKNGPISKKVFFAVVFYGHCILHAVNVPWTPSILYTLSALCFWRTALNA